MNEFIEALRRHAEAEEQKFKDLNEAVSTIRDNHLVHIKLSIGEIKTDLKWVKWLVMGVGMASLTSLVTRIVGLL